MTSKKNAVFYKIVDCEEEIEQLYQKKPIPTRNRTKLSTIQTAVLEKIYARNSYPNKDEHVAIARKLCIPLKNVKIWFQNRRAKQKSYLTENDVDNSHMEPDSYNSNIMSSPNSDVSRSTGSLSRPNALNRFGSNGNLTYSPNQIKKFNMG